MNGVGGVGGGPVRAFFSFVEAGFQSFKQGPGNHIHDAFNAFAEAVANFFHDNFPSCFGGGVEEPSPGAEHIAPDIHEKEYKKYQEEHPEIHWVRPPKNTAVEQSKKIQVTEPLKAQNPDPLKELQPKLRKREPPVERPEPVKSKQPKPSRVQSEDVLTLKNPNEFLTRDELAAATVHVRQAEMAAEADVLKEREAAAEQVLAAAAKAREAEAPLEPPKPAVTPARIELGELAGWNEIREQASVWQRQVKWGEKLFGNVPATPSSIRDRNQAVKKSATESVKPLAAAPLRMNKNTLAAEAVTNPDVPKLCRDPRRPIKIAPQPRGILRQRPADEDSTAQPADEDSAAKKPAKKVTFSEQPSEVKTYDNRERGLKRTTSRRIGAERDARNSARKELLQLDEEARKIPHQHFVETERFLNLMTIAHEKGPAHAHGLAIQLLGQFRSKFPSDEWMKEADRTLRDQLQGRTNQEMLNALEPVIAHFDRYKVLEDNTKNKDFLGLIELGAILHRIRRDVEVGSFTPPDSRTSS